MHSRAGPRSLAATKGISIDFFSSGYLDVSVLRVRFLTPMYSVQDNLQAGWVFPFGDPRVKACLSARRGLSQISTSFIAFYRLGIHHMRLFTWPYNPKQPHLSTYKQVAIKKVVVSFTLIKSLQVTCHAGTWFNILININTRTQWRLLHIINMFMLLLLQIQIFKEHRYLE